MRIAQVCPYSLTVPGGVQAQVLGLGRALREMGHETRVLAPCDGPPPDPMVTPLGASVPTAANGSIAPIAPDPACALRTLHSLRNERFEILHLHEPLAPGPTLTALIGSDVTKIGTFHAAESNTRVYNWMPWALPKVASRLHLRVAVSEEAKATAQRSLKGRYEVLYNGIEVERFRNRDAIEKLGPTIFFLGRHEHRKGLEVLIEAMAHMPSNVRLWIAGLGPQTHALQAATAGDMRIEWLGRISDEEKADRLASADVFCAPSTEGESFGIVLLEAMAAGTPVVASDLPGYRNVAREGIDAALVPPGDAVQLAQGITRVLSNSGLASSLVTSGTERAESFAMKQLALRYVELYERAQSQLRV